MTRLLTIIPGGEELFNRYPAHSRTWTLLALLVSLLVLSQASCAHSSPAPTSEPLTIGFGYSESMGSGVYYHALGERFHELYPQIAIQFLRISAQDIGSVPADVLMLGPAFLTSDRAPTLRELQEQGKILNLDMLVEQDESFDPSDFYPGTLEICQIGGQTWAVPAGLDPLVMYYDKEVFDRYGVAYPTPGWTWDDFLSTALALRDPNAGVYGFGYTPGDGSELSFIYQHGGRIFDDWREPSRTTFDDPLTVGAMEWFADLMYRYDVMGTGLSSDGVLNSRFVAEGVRGHKIGMWAGFISGQGWSRMAVGEGARLGMVPLPRDAQYAAYARHSVYVISSQTQHIDEAWRWIAFLSEQVPYSEVPARKSLIESDVYGQTDSSDAALGKAAVENVILLAPGMSKFRAQMELFSQAVDDIIMGVSFPTDALSQAQEQAADLP